MLGALIWFSYCIELWKENSDKTSYEINKISFDKMICFFQKVPQDTRDIEKYFKDAYPMYM